MSKDDLIQEIKREIARLVRDKYDKEGAAVQKDIALFLNQSKEKLLRWTFLWEEKKLTEEEFAILVNSQKDFFIINVLYRKGVSAVSLGHFKNQIVDIIIQKAIGEA